MAQKLETRSKKTLFCVKFSPRNLYLPKVAFKKSLYFQKSLVGALNHVLGETKVISQKVSFPFKLNCGGHYIQ